MDTGGWDHSNNRFSAVGLKVAKNKNSCSIDWIAYNNKIWYFKPDLSFKK